MINIIINGRPIAVEEGTTLLEAARSADIDIPKMISTTVLPASVK